MFFCNRIQIAENLFCECCKGNSVRTLYCLKTCHVQQDFRKMGKPSGLFLKHGEKSVVFLGCVLRLFVKTSRFVCITAKGVRSSCAALATNRFCAEKALSRRASMSLKDLVRREISSSESGTSSGSDRFCACTWRILSLNLRRGVRALLVTNQVQILLRRIMIPVAIMLWNKNCFGILDLVFQIRDEDFWIYIDGDRV